MSTRFASKAMFATLSAAAALFTVTAVAPAQAADLDAPTRIVRYGDLDLTTATGSTTLQRRVARAANAVCGITGNREELALTMARNTCRTAAIASAEPKMQMLFAEAKSGTRVADAGAALTLAAAD